MRIVVIGSGGREHALAWRLLCGAGDQPLSGRSVVVVPGNAGIEADFRARGLAPARARCQAAVDRSIDALVRVCRDADADLVVVGPEQPLVDGVVDALAAAGIAAFGPTASAARLEASKAFMKDVAAAARVPTAAHVTGTQLDDVRAFIDERRAHGRGVVVKADGLCAGKGVVVCPDAADAVAHVQAMLAGRFGPASHTVVVEDLLPGLELSVFALCDGDDAVLYGAARDHKRIGDGDTGPNTGGMGAVYPLDARDGVDDAMLERIRRESIVPVLHEMKRRGAPFRGVLFAGLMVEGLGDHGMTTSSPTPRLLEFNVRFGDPECEALMLATPVDLAPILLQIARGERLPSSLHLLSEQKAACVVCAARGYPDAPEPGALIEGLDEARRLPGVHVYCAGVGERGDGALVVAGGRVLAVTAVAASFDAALDRAYLALSHLRFEGMQHRRDIGATVRARPST